ncbi:MAG: hypothetical protein MK160_03610 [Rhodobacteraceae bacterium]|nr:hypothetical protein [Paracoccaceae bacterium]
MRALVGAIGFWIGVLGSVAQAATVERYDDPFMGCIARISGPIAKGDTERLDAVLTKIAKDGDQTNFSFSNEFLERPQQAEHFAKFTNWQESYRVCFDSPGGSLIEGIELGKYLFHNHVGSAVSKRASCLSACAVAFMGGVDFSDNGLQNNRVLLVRGALGFHSPSLIVPDDNYSKHTVEVAYGAALRTMAVILRNAEALRFKRSLIEAMLATPPSEFKMIETVFDAGRWGIGVVGTVYPDEINPMAMRHACSVVEDYSATFSFTQPLQDYPVNERTSSDREMLYTVDFQVDGEDHSIKFNGLPFRDTKCTISVHPVSSQAVAELKNGLPEWVYASAGTMAPGLPVWPAYFFHPTTRLRDLARESDHVFETRSVLTTQPRPISEKSECYVFKGPQLLDHEPCSVEVIFSEDVSLKRKTTGRFTWPSGGVTVVEDEGVWPPEYRINGKPAESFEFFKDQPISNGPCFVNTASGNTFCVEYRASFRSL